jgi:two-component system, OmpR family, sensor histidine kinase KdpD
VPNWLVRWGNGRVSGAGWRAVAVPAAALLALALSSALIAVLQGPPLRVPNASAVYLVAIVVVAVLGGTWAAVACSVAAFFLFDFLFIQPIGSLTVAEPTEWLNLVLFLLVAVTIGQLAALQTQRANDATRRAREARAQFRISRTLATSDGVAGAAPSILTGLVAEAGLDRAWLTALQGTAERLLADSTPDAPRPGGPSVSTLSRRPGDEPARWVRAHLAPGTTAASDPARPTALYRVTVASDDETVGYLWAVRLRSAGDPTMEATRLMALAADQLGLALKRERLAREATAAAVARESEALKTALLDSVSHDLRTPLASIRAAAGALMDPAVPFDDDERRQVARTIDSEAERLDRIVHNVLDMSRIEAGALRPELEVLPLDSAVGTVVQRMAPSFGSRLRVDLPDDLPPVLVDAVYLDEAVTNLLENALRHGGPEAAVRVGAAATAAGRVAVTIEDGGRGVPPEAMPHLFEKFYRVRQPGESSRRGLGIGLSVVKGMVEAMGGTVTAGASELGGLAVTLDLPAAPMPPDEAAA